MVHLECPVCGWHGEEETLEGPLQDTCPQCGVDLLKAPRAISP